MAIKKIKVTNFKSFKELEIELGDLNILIGANASGKSNFIEIFRFLRDIERSTLDNAISLQGGVEYLRNVNIDSSEVLSLEIVSDQRFRIKSPYTREVHSRFGITVYEIIYKFAISFDESELGFGIVEDKLVLKCEFIKQAEQEEDLEEVGEKVGNIIISKKEGRIGVDLENGSEESLKPLQDVFLKSYMSPNWPHGILLLETLYYSPLELQFLLVGSGGFPIYDFGRDFPIYNFGRGILRDAVSMAAKAELEENGSNLAVVLKNIMNKADGKRKLLNLVDYALPFVDDLTIEKLADKFLLFKLKEKYSDQYLPGFLLSDGTINMIALIVALYFEEKPLTIIEEPDRGIHPYLISGVIDMMRDASESKQIIVTTHNPEMVRYANKEDILLISRNEEGFTTICKPSEKEDVNRFLKNGMRMEELYVNDLLEL